MTNQDRLDLMIDGINMLRNAGLDPIGFKMDAYLLEGLLSTDKRAEISLAGEVGVGGLIDVEHAMNQYRYELMGIPIEPDFGKNEIKAIKKVGMEK